jgi:hypothetical protein
MYPGLANCLTALIPTFPAVSCVYLKHPFTYINERLNLILSSLRSFGNV